MTRRWDHIDCIKCDGAGMANDFQCNHEVPTCDCFRDKCDVCAGMGVEPCPRTEVLNNGRNAD
jgi:hypothetical protein